MAMQPEKLVRVLVVDYRTVVGSGISVLLGGYPDLSVAGHIEDQAEALCYCEKHHPDVVCLDFSFPGETSGVEVIRQMRHSSPQTRIIVLTNVAEGGLVRQALQDGATSYLLKSISPDELVLAIRAASQGRSMLSPEVTQLLIQALSTPETAGQHFTEREQQILGLIAQGQSNREIAQALNVSLFTVQFHVKNIFSKLGVHNRSAAATYAVRQGLGKQLY